MNQDNNELKDYISKLEQRLKETESALSESRAETALLADYASSLNSLESIQSIYALASRTLFDIIGNAGAIIIADFNETGDRWKIAHIEGLSSFFESITKVVGYDLRNMENSSSPDLFNKIAHGKLTDMGTDLTYLTKGIISHSATKILLNLIGIKAIHCITFKKDDRNYGNVTFISSKNTKPLSTSLIERLISLTAISLEKQHFSNATKENEEKFREIIEQSKDIHYKQDFNSGRVLYMSPSVETILEYPVTEIENMDLNHQKSLFYDDDFHRVRDFSSELVVANKKGIPFIDMEFRMKSKTGKIVWIHGTYSLKTDENGKPSFIIGLLRDVTDRKAFETELLKAKEKAEESDRLKSAFLANLSHEIRTPMNGIIGFTELLQRHEFSAEDNDRFLDVISQSSERMLNIINDLIDISIIESGQMNVEICPVHINQILDSAYNFFIQKAQKKGLKLVKFAGLNAPDDLIATDSHKLYAILSNLINNACKFTQNGNVTFGYIKSGNYLLFSVEDTGIGMDDETQAFVFDRFRQAEISSSRTYEGAGLGLSIARSYVEMLGGKIRVESQKGKGSVFYFTLPIRDASDQSAGTKPMNPELHSGFVKKIKILIAEDNEESDLLLTTILEEISSEILHTESGISVVEICRENPDIDLILMDIKLTGQSGIDATKQIRSFNKTVVIVGQTAYAQQGDPEKIILAGCNGYLSKPILKQPLMDEILRHFNK